MLSESIIFAKVGAYTVREYNTECCIKSLKKQKLRFKENKYQDNSDKPWYYQQSIGHLKLAAEKNIQLEEATKKTQILFSLAARPERKNYVKFNYVDKILIASS